MGSLTTGGRTDDLTLALSGTNESGATVNIYNDTTLLGSATVSGASWSYSATVVNGNTYAFNAKATDVAGNTGATATSFTTTVDTVAATVSSVSISGATGLQNSSLNVGDVLTATVTMSEAATVTGTPKLALNIGGTTVQALYASGTGTSALNFAYTIATAQTDANGISIAANALTLNGGTLADIAGTTAVITHALVADNTGRPRPRLSASPLRAGPSSSTR